MIVDIGEYKIGKDRCCFVIAEAGVNHNGEIRLAKKLVDVAVDSRADAIKFQTFKADRLAIPDAPKAAYQLRNTNAAESQYEMLRRLELSESDHFELYKYCCEKNILFLSTSFDEQSADFLEQLGVRSFKIPSGEITNIPLLVHVAKKGKPIILSTGMSSISEINEAIAAIKGVGLKKVVLLQCVSNYPADPKDVNLRTIEMMRKIFDVPVGYSDHTLGIEISLAAVALGACVIEKHFTLDRSMVGPDHTASIEPHELKALVAGVRRVEAALGDGFKKMVANEVEMASVIRKSLVAACFIPSGTIVTEEMVVARRPGNGIPPSNKASIVGRIAYKDIEAGMLLNMSMFS